MPWLVQLAQATCHRWRLHLNCVARFALPCSIAVLAWSCHGHIQVPHPRLGSVEPFLS